MFNASWQRVECSASWQRVECSMLAGRASGVFNASWQRVECSMLAELAGRGWSVQC